MIPMESKTKTKTRQEFAGQSTREKTAERGLARFPLVFLKSSTVFCSAQGCDEITTSGEIILKGSGKIVIRDYIGLVIIFVPTSQNGETL